MKIYMTITLFMLGITAAVLAIVYMKRTQAKFENILDSVDYQNETSQRFSTYEDMQSAFEKAGLSQHWEYIKPYVREQITLTSVPTTEDTLTIGQSKIGGRPDLPADVAWFNEDNGKSLAFIAQINLREVQDFHKTGALPDSGLLYFFYSAEQEAWGYDPADKAKFKVFYFNGDLSKLQRIDFPKDISEYARYKPCTIAFAKHLSLPNWEHDFISNHLNDDEQNRYIELSTQSDFTHKLLGHSDNIQGTMELDCALATNGLYLGDASGYNDPRAKELAENAYDWRLLLQIDSEEEKTGMMWGDAGRLYFWIKQQDLQVGNFDNCWLILQCY